MKQNDSELPNGYLETIQNGIAGVRTFRSGISRGTGTRQENLGRLKEEKDRSFQRNYEQYAKRFALENGNEAGN